jgi:hypothetical protein
VRGQEEKPLRREEDESLRGEEGESVRREEGKPVRGEKPLCREKNVTTGFKMRVFSIVIPSVPRGGLPSGRSKESAVESMLKQIPRPAASE